MELDLFEIKLKVSFNVFVLFFVLIVFAPLVFAAEPAEPIRGVGIVNISLKGLLVDVQGYVEKIDDDLEKSLDITDEITKIKNLSFQIETLDEKIKNDFKKNSRLIANAGLPEMISERLEIVLATYEKSLSDFFNNVANLERINNEMFGLSGKELKEKKDELAVSLATFNQFLFNAIPEVRQDPLNLPGIKRKKINKGPSSKEVGKNNSAITFSSLLKKFYDFLVPSLYAATPVMPEDLVETADIQFAPEITTISSSSSMGGNTVEIFEYVKNNFKYEPYYGALKGAMNTLREGGGNDMDLASLLIALYRSAGIPARYVHGRVEIPIDKAMAWLGVTAPEMVPMIFASNGVPVESVHDGAGLRSVIIDHTWVSAFVPFGNARGAVNGPGDTWVYLDPSFKKTETSQTLSVDGLPDFIPSDYLSTLRTEDTVTYYENLIDTYLDTAHPNYVSRAVYQEQNTELEYFGMFLGPLPYEVIETIDNVAMLSAETHHMIGFKLIDSKLQTTLFQYEASSVDIGRKRVSLSYVPATSADEAVIEQYGDIYSTPAYLVHVIAELKVNGVTVASSGSIGLGDGVELEMTFTAPDGNVESLTNNLYAGGYHAIVFNLQEINTAMSREKFDDLKNAATKIEQGVFVDRDDVAGEILYDIGLGYFQNLDMGYEKIKKLYGMVSTRQVISTAIVSLEVKPTYMFGIPSKLKVTGLSIDVDRETHSAFPIDGDLSKRKDFITLGGYLSSFIEHNIFKKLYNVEAVSSVKIIQYANSNGIPVLHINSGNLSTLISQLSTSQAIVSEVENVVNAGMEVIIPAYDITINSWNGTGYIIVNPDTGEADYRISSGLSGGETVDCLGGSSCKEVVVELMRAKISFVEVAMFLREQQMTALLACLNETFVFYPGPDNLIGQRDDVKLKIAYQKDVGGKLDFTGDESCYQSDKNPSDLSLTPNQYYVPSSNILSNMPLVDIGSLPITTKLSKNIAIYDFLGGPNGQDINKPPLSNYARISPSFLRILESWFSLIDNSSSITNEGYGVGYWLVSGYRNVENNCLYSGSELFNSDHLRGVAVDIHFEDFEYPVVSPDTSDRGIAYLLADRYIGRLGGVGKGPYITNLHIDYIPSKLKSNGSPRRW